MQYQGAASDTLSIKDVLISVLTIAGSFAAAWLGARFSLRNFYQERRWDRKADAYTLIFAAIHDVERWYDKHFEASATGREIQDDRKKRLRDEANRAEEDLERCVDAQAWNLPPEFVANVFRLSTDLKNITTTDWNDFLGRSIQVLHRATAELIALAKKDLKIK
jgi:hypothetical protein